MRRRNARRATVGRKVDGDEKAEFVQPLERITCNA